jgi:FkbM family methyltransferase
MIGVLFGDLEVEIDPRTASLGGAWEKRTRNDGKLYAQDQGTLEFFWKRVCEIECPVVVDVGASTGSFSLVASVYADASVIAFEPHPTVYDVLITNLALNGVLSTSAALMLALANYDGRAVLRAPKRQTGFGTIGEGPLRAKSRDISRLDEIVQYDVDVRRMDVFFGESDRVDIVKIDVEGAELLVLRGGELMIRRWMPALLLEHDARNIAQFDYAPSEIIALLTQWGYTKFEHVGEYDLWVTD